MLLGVSSRPFAAAAQQSSVPRIGFLTARSPDESAAHTAAFLRGLEQSDYVDGRSMAMEYRWARGQYDRLPALAGELVTLHLSVLAAGGDAAALAAKAATTVIPISFLIGDDPIRIGLVESLNRPGRNATGVSLISSALGAKRLELLSELVPGAAPIGLLVNSGNSNAAVHSEEVGRAAKSLGRRLAVAAASTVTEMDGALGNLAQQGCRGLVVENDPFFDAQRERLVALSNQHRLPAIYHIREFPAAGGLISYGPSLTEAYRDLGVQTARILKGTLPADLPVVRPSKFDVVINLNAAKKFGITIPPATLLRADEVIE